MRLQVFIKLFIFVLLAGGLVLPVATKAVSDYIILSSYYIYPGLSLKVKGYGFFPRSQVTVSFAGQNQAVTTNTAGDFVASGLVVPYNITGSKATITARDKQGDLSTASLSIAGYYPTVIPSGYYLSQGDKINFNGKNFAPREKVVIKNKSSILAILNADSKGSFNTTDFTLPYTAGQQTYYFFGQSSGTAAAVLVQVADWKPVITLSSYYLSPGSYVQIQGHQFGSNEPVSLVYDGLALGSVTADSKGSFSATIQLPILPITGRAALDVQGVSTGLKASAELSLEP